MSARLVRIAHFSDLHYGPKNLTEADRCFGFAVDQAIERQVDVAVISGDATDHALNLHSPSAGALAHQVRRLAQHCPVLMLQGTYSHEPPGTLGLFRLLSSRSAVHVAQRIAQVALTHEGRWVESGGWRFDALPQDTTVLFSCVPTVNKAAIAASLGATQAAEGVGEQLAALLAGYAPGHRAARQCAIPTVGVSHGTVTGCLTEHGVPMAGFDHEFTSTALLSAGADAFLLGHIHKHQTWEQDGRIVAYAGSIGRFHHGEEGDKGFLLWEVGDGKTRLELVATPARRTLDYFFDGKPDVALLERAAQSGELLGASVRVRWTIADEDRHEVDRAAIERALAGAADVQLEARIVPVLRSRAQGISRAGSLEEKLRTWAQLSTIRPQPLIGRLQRLAGEDPIDIVRSILQPQAEPVAGADPHPADKARRSGVEEADGLHAELPLSN